MNLRLSRNHPLELGWVPKGTEDYSLIQTSSVNYTPNYSQESILSKEDFLLHIDNLSFPIGISNRIKEGRYRVLEKWIYPYWKSQNRFYYPSETNPIGKYLIILGSDETGEKIPEGFHQWANWEFETKEFKQGQINNRGCVRLNPHNIEEIFQKLSLGSLIVVK